MIKKISSILILSLLFISCNKVHNNYINKTKIVYVDNNINMVDSILTYRNIFSKSTKDSILKYIKKTSTEYDIPVLLIHSIIDAESSYRFWITHNDIYVRGKKTNAIGLGGIVWDYWSDTLKTINIYNKTDLYLPKYNISAIGKVLYTIINKQHTTTLKGIVTKYYGEYNKQYYEKISKSIFNIYEYKLQNKLTHK